MTDKQEIAKAGIEEISWLQHSLPTFGSFECKRIIAALTLLEPVAAGTHVIVDKDLLKYDSWQDHEGD